MDRLAALARIEAEALIAVIRADSADRALDICRALHAGGVLVQEIAMTTPDGVRAIERATDELDDCLIGAGTVLDAAMARAVAEAGAGFVFAPNVDTAVIETVVDLGLLAFPGALTPTEIAAADAAGADAIKLFPANYFGPKYIRDIHGPLPHVKIVPTGGVDTRNIGDWLAAGALAVGAGTSMVRPDLVADRRWDDLAEHAGRFVRAVGATRRSERPVAP